MTPPQTTTALTQCLSPQNAVLFATGQLKDAALESAEAHLDGCESCRGLVSNLLKVHTHTTQSQLGQVSDDWQFNLAPGRLGRFELQERIAQGPMSAVYKAFDSELGRPVAIKMWRLPSDPNQAVTISAGLWLEAKALARIRHPHVVSVHDVALIDGTPFLVMEWLEGQPLSEIWPNESSWKKLLQILLDAAQGLEHAHAQGIIHRDIKPANIMVTRSSRAVVVDFGIATLRQSGQGEYAGTPAYMAPEAKRQEALDERSDIYSFCMAAFETLTKQRFAGNTSELRRIVPRSVASIIVRGLEHDASQRPASLLEFIACFEKALSPATTKKRWVIAASMIVIAGTAAALSLRTNQSSPTQACAAEFAEQTQSVWNPDVRTSVEAVFARSNRPYSKYAAKTVNEQLDAFFAGLQGEMSQACQHSSQNSEQVICLRELYQTGTKFIERLGNADDSVIEKAVNMVSSLPLPSLCARFPQAIIKDTKLTSHPIWPLYQELTQLVGSARIIDGESVAAKILAEPSWKSEPLVAAQVEMLLGTFRSIQGAPNKDVLDLLESAARNADLARLDYVRALAWREIASINMHRMRDLAAADRALGFSEVAIARLGNPDELRFHTMSTRGIWYSLSGKIDEAVATLSLVADGQEKLYGRPNEQWLKTLDYLGNVLLDRDPQKAEAVLRRSAAMWESMMGPEYPSLGVSLIALAGALTMQSKLAEAEVHLRRAQKLVLSQVPATHHVAMAAFTNLQQVLGEQKKYEEAIAGYRQAIEQFSNLTGPDSLEVAETRLDLAVLLSNAKRSKESAQELDLVLPVFEKKQVLTNPTFATAYLMKGVLLGRSGKNKQALAFIDRAAKLAEGGALGRKAEIALTRAEILWPTDHVKAIASAKQARSWADEWKDPALVEQVDAWFTKFAPDHTGNP